MPLVLNKGVLDWQSLAVCVFHEFLQVLISEQFVEDQRLYLKVSMIITCW